ncbi:glycosyltransferase family 39 protein [Candidatus Woesearchaeota archaeon]|nr:glycosyltransferase family 39 protein [Candidatus Woesearchaeota archaeon]
MKITREHWILALIFFLVIAARLFFTLPEKGFDYEAYDSLRQAEHIRMTGLPLYQDSLSYSGRAYLFPPLFYYLLAGFSFIIPLELAAKLLPTIAFAFLVPVIYLIAKHLTKNKTAALIAAFFSGTVPIVYSTLNQSSVYSVILLLTFLLSYAFMRVDEKGFAAMCIVLTILALLTNTAVFLLLLSLLVYCLIVKLEKQELSKKEVEITLFLFFLALWFNLLLFKRAFFIHGISFIWQNLPSPLLSSYFRSISFLGVIYAVGVIPLLLGVYAVYHAFFKTKNQNATLYISFAVVSFIMLWLKLIPLKIGLLLLSISLIILASYSIKIIIVSISKTKVPKMITGLIITLLLLFAITTLTPLSAVTKNLKINTPTQQDIQALQWLRNNSDQNSIVLGTAEEGFLISYEAQRKNVADQNFLFIPNINQRYNDINHLYNLRLKSEAILLLNEYDVDYILLSEASMKAYNITSLFYAEPDCFEIVYNNTALIYKFLKCEIK